METVVLGLTLLSLLIWIILLAFRGQFWRANVQLTPISLQLNQLPRVCAVIPARNEADVLPQSLRSLFLQDYPNPFRVILVDDRSTDDTAKVAQNTAKDAKAVAKEMGRTAPSLEVLTAEPLPPGWTGKLWAMEQGVRHAKRDAPDYYLFTDADIEHDRSNLRQLVLHAERERLDLVSLMVRLRCRSFWERCLIPPFVYFFQKLYPFEWANDINNKTAAAAGGCILIRRQALERIGGLNAIKQTLIDDCSLARAVKCGEPGKRHPIWVGLTEKTRSLRPYNSLWSIWNMVARTAYTQLNYSPFLLIFTILGMGLTYWVAPVAFVWGILEGDRFVALIALANWLLMAFSLLPTLRLYRQPPFLGIFLPIIAVLYTFMTIDSAIRHWFGFGGNWKGRVYPQA
ncbi:glycosyltransferase [Baaleninema sp.]|uniref:glycosyltransferase n=1 Tax=Baaleninema sp. TaxID=3101197 RepID=UPI003D016DCD